MGTYIEDRKKLSDTVADLFALTLPLIICNILQQFYNTFDAFVLGRSATQTAFAAVGVGGTILNLFLFAVTGACTGISVLFARFFGADDMEKFRRMHFSVLISGIAASVVFAAVGIVMVPSVLEWMQTPKEVAALAGSYLTVVLLALPASFIYNFYNAMFRAAGRVRAILAILASAVGLNLFLDLLLTAHFGMGISGVAVGTASAQIFSAVCSGIYLLKRMPEFVFKREDRTLDREILLETFRLSSVTALQQAGLYLGKIAVQGAVNTGGVAMISAYTATTRIEGFANSFGDSGAAATSVMTARAVGAREPEKLKNAVAASFILMLVIGAASSVILFLGSGLFSGLLIGSYSGEAYVQAREYLKIVAVFYTLCFIGNTFAGTFDGIGKVVVTFVGSAGHIALRAVLCRMFIRQYGLPFVAVATGIGWIGVNIYWTIRLKGTAGKHRDAAEKRRLKSKAAEA